MPNVTITHAELDNEKRNIIETVPSVFCTTAWAVTPSRRPEITGFVVTHVPTGTQAWPNPAAGQQVKSSMTEAITKCKELRDVWDKPTQVFPDVTRTRIAALVGAAC